METSDLFEFIYKLTGFCCLESELNAIESIVLKNIPSNEYLALKKGVQCLNDSDDPLALDFETLLNRFQLAKGDPYFI